MENLKGRGHKSLVNQEGHNMNADSQSCEDGTNLHGNLIDALYNGTAEQKAEAYETIVRLVDESQPVRNLMHHVRAPDEATFEAWKQEAHLRFVQAISKKRLHKNVKIVGWYYETVKRIACEYAQSVRNIEDGNNLDDLEKNGYGLIWASKEDDTAYFSNDDNEGKNNNDHNNKAAGNRKITLEQGVAAMHQRLQIMLAKLKPIEQRIIELSYLTPGLETNATEIGKTVGASAANVRKIKERAIKKLKKDN
jgi:RNA polymerase sigma factor (sigma-70 family)